MPLLLTRTDIQRFWTDRDFLAGGLDAMRDVFLEQRDGGREFPWTVLPLHGDRRTLRVAPAASLANGVSIRVYPAYAGARDVKDAFMILLLDGVTGELCALMSGDDLNVLRTGLPAGVAARVLAPQGATTLALLGSGRQARGQTIAITAGVPAIREVRIFSPTREHREAFAVEMAALLGLDVRAVDTAKDAVSGAHVIDVASNARGAVLEAGWVGPGALVVSITSGQLPPDLVAGSRVVVSARRGLTEGEGREPYATMAASGAWSYDRIAGELADVLAGEAGGRVSREDVVVFEMPGMSAWDAALASWTHRWATERRLGTPFQLTDD